MVTKFKHTYMDIHTHTLTNKLSGYALWSGWLRKVIVLMRQKNYNDVTTGGMNKLTYNV
jgi:hypothetical protein